MLGPPRAGACLVRNRVILGLFAAQRRWCNGATQPRSSSQWSREQRRRERSDARRASDAALEGLREAVQSASGDTDISSDPPASDSIAGRVEAIQVAWERERKATTLLMEEELSQQPVLKHSEVEPPEAVEEHSIPESHAPEVPPPTGVLQQIMERLSVLEARAGPVPLALCCVSEEVPEATGRWELILDSGISGPVWSKGTHRLFTDADGRWMFSPDEASMRVGSGWIHSRFPHGGTLPHLMREWEFWSGTSWSIAESIRLTAARDDETGMPAAEKCVLLEKRLLSLESALDVLIAGQYRRTHNAPPPLSVCFLPPCLH